MAKINFDDIERRRKQAGLKPINTVETPRQYTPVASKMTQAEYDALLGSDEVPPPLHNPNPFDFVFFAKSGSKTYSLADFNTNYGDLESGYIEVKLTAKTPVHIVGKQEPVTNCAGKKIQKSDFYKQDDQPCIPGSSIKGMLRSFIEAVTNGWVSQANEKYNRGDGNPKIRHIEFASWGLEGNGHNHGCISGQNHKPSPAIPLKFKPSLAGDVDIATYLFGYVDEGTKSARAGRVIIEDVYFDNNLLKHDCKMVDIDGKAIMGGPTPRANWWYMKPKEVWNRSVQGGARRVAHIVGDEFWGRKFYYHQDPEKCIDKYIPDNGWTVYKYDMSCLDKDKEASFYIYFDRVPPQLIQLFCTCLCMQGNMRHKLGYGKAFGYGSVEFSIISAMLRTEKAEYFPDPLSPPKYTMVKAWTDTEIRDFIDTPSLNTLAQILTWDNNNTIIFTYPPYNDSNFKKVIQKHEFCTSTLPLANLKNTVDDASAVKVARALWDIKKPVHFQLYQARANGYETIKLRKP